MRITNIQKKELSVIFRKYELNILDFETSGDYKEFKIKFKPDYFSFLVERRSMDEYFLTILPVDNTSGYGFAATWEQTKSRFEIWTSQIADELNTPTGWSSFQTVNLLDFGFEVLQNEFTSNEKIQTRQSLLEIKEKIKSLELSNESLTIIEVKLDYLSNKIDELNKFDWKSLFIGTIASLIMTLSIPPEASGLIWEYIKTSFSGLRLNG